MSRTSDISSRIYLIGPDGGRAIELAVSREADAWRGRVTPKLEALGWKQAYNDDHGLTLRLAMEEWVPRAPELVEAIL